MPTWNPERSPDRFPPRWHELLRDSVAGETKLLAVVKTLREAERTRYKFAAFRASLRTHPAHATFPYLARLDTRVVLEPRGDHYALLLEIKHSKTMLISGSGFFGEAMGKGIDTSNGLG